jgi:glyceraldehyde-3-phosphate dehydrogenase (NADP+)
MASAPLTSDKELVVHDPDDGSLVGTLPLSSLCDVENALERGHRAVRSNPPAHERSRILQGVADRLQADVEGHAHLIAREGIKTIREARREVGRAIETLRLSAEEAKRIGGTVVPFDQVPSGEGRLGWWAFRPAGLIIAITPYNDPLNLVAHKLGPAFAAGCPIILKPHPQTPFSAMRLVEHFHAEGAASDRVQIVIGGSDVAAALVSDRRPHCVSFTGGRKVGKEIARQAGIKHLILELGGVGIVAVAGDADLEAAAEAITSGAFWAAGQNCVRAQRIIVNRGVASELADLLTMHARKLRLGPKLDEATDIGPLVTPAHAGGLARTVEEMTEAGGQVLTGGSCQGSRMKPTWVGGLPDAHPLLTRELFGPVSTIEVARDDRDLLDRLESGEDAIHAAIFTQSITNMIAAFKRCNSAALLVNDTTDYRIDAMPFGGIGAAGLGREGVADAVAAYSEKKMMILRALETSSSPPMDPKKTEREA